MGRDVLDYAQLEPGVVLQSGQSFDPTKAGYSAISVSGVGGRTTRILLDGQDITDETVGNHHLQRSFGRDSGVPAESLDPGRLWFGHLDRPGAGLDPIGYEQLARKSVL